MKNSGDHLPGVYSIWRAESPLPLVLDSPHSGRDYPAGFDHACAPDLLKRAEDSRVDELFDTAPRHGGALLAALFPRTYIDVNRAPSDIDSVLLAGPWPGTAHPTGRSHAGIGLIRRLVKPGVPVYDRKLTAQEIQGRLDGFYAPYHDVLKGLLDEAHYNFGQVWHVDCHSMPSPEATPAPDFVIGDRDGSTSARAFTHAVRDILKGMGYNVALNNPYKGVEILRRHADPRRGRHSIQLEVSKGLYWDEQRDEPGGNFAALKADIDRLIAGIAAFVRGHLISRAAD